MLIFIFYVVQNEQVSKSTALFVILLQTVQFKEVVKSQLGMSSKNVGRTSTMKVCCIVVDVCSTYLTSTKIL